MNLLLLRPSRGGKKIRPSRLPNPNPEDSRSTLQIRSLLHSTVQRAKRGGYWFKLGPMGRSICTLALRLHVRFESVGLIRAVVSVMSEIKALGDASYARLRRGAEMAWALSEAATRWGNPYAKAWRNDMDYIAFLGWFYPRC